MFWATLVLLAQERFHISFTCKDKEMDRQRKEYSKRFPEDKRVESIESHAPDSWRETFQEIAGNTSQCVRFIAPLTDHGECIGIVQDDLRDVLASCEAEGSAVDKYASVVCTYMVSELGVVHVSVYAYAVGEPQIMRVYAVIGNVRWRIRHLQDLRDVLNFLSTPEVRVLSRESDHVPDVLIDLSLDAAKQMVCHAITSSSIV